MLRAAARLVDNREAVTRFAARGCGRPGRRPVSAPLADSTAEPGEEYLPAVNAGCAPGSAMVESCGMVRDPCSPAPSASVLQGALAQLMPEALMKSWFCCSPVSDHM